jgi:hypothetical protein
MGHGYTQAAAITPHDTNVVTVPHDQLWVSHADGSADVAVVPVGGSAVVTFADVPSGTLLPIKVKKVRATETTAGTTVIGVWGR